MGSNVPVVNKSMNEMICESPEFFRFLYAIAEIAFLTSALDMRRAQNQSDSRIFS